MSDRMQGIAFVLVMIFCIVFLLYNYRVGAAVPFDHSLCQYPTRTTNPPGGCDNSDPANPFCSIKNGEDCDPPAKEVQTPAPVKNVEPAPSQPVASNPEPVFEGK